MKKLALCLVLVWVAACDQVGPWLSEAATVEDFVFRPESHGSAVGFTSDGNSAVSSVDEDAIYAVVFRCAHGRFAVSGADFDHKFLWSSLRKGQAVRIVYAERSSSFQPHELLGYKFYSADPAVSK